jgi:hypothetical protein
LATDGKEVADLKTPAHRLETDRLVADGKVPGPVFVAYSIVATREWPEFLAVKTSHGAAMDVLLDKIMAGEVRPPYGPADRIAAEHDSTVAWIKSMTAEQRAKLRRGVSYGNDDDSNKLTAGFARLCDTYKVDLEILSPSP